MHIINSVKKYAFFGVVFSVAKATVYFAPLLLADLLSKTDFGILEYALAGLGMVVNTIINLGVPGAYPYFILRLKKENLKNAFKLHPIILLVPFVINQMLYIWFDLNINFYLAFNISFIIANQVFYSTQLKSHEKSTVAVLLDSGIYVVLILFFQSAKQGIIPANIKTINVFVLAYSLIYVLYGIFNYFNHRNTISIEKYKQILKFSIHLLISTFLIFLITTSGRILVEFFFDYEAVGLYAFYFRLAAIVVMIYQVVSIAFFKKIYTFSPKVLDRYYFMFFLFISTLSLAIFVIAPYIVGEFSNYFNETYQNNQKLYFLLSLQMVFWIASALNSSIIDRENLAPKNNIRFLILVIISCVVLYLQRENISLEMLVYIHFTIIYLACLIQYFSLSKKQIYFFKSAISLSIVFISSTCYYLIFL